MKSLRIFVIVLLAMLLPLRAVSAAAVTCGPQAASHTQTVVMPHDHQMHNSGAAQDDASQVHDHEGFDKTRHCVSSCSAAPLMSALPSVAAPTTASSTVFPRYAAPAPTFQSGGQDRPPRSI